jgi:ADP-dependent phosphofructokinase/glucokinase
MKPNPITLRMHTERAMRATTEQEMREVIRVAMIAGMQEGISQKEAEIKEALSVLGFGDLAYKNDVDQT